LPPLLLLFVSCTSSDTGGDSGPGDSDTEHSDELLVDRDVLYQEAVSWDDALARLDVYYRDDGVERRPLVFVHGGSWVGGDKSNLDETEQFVPWFLEQGYAVIAPNFRLASAQEPQEVTWRDQVADLSAALGWVDANRTPYGLDTSDPVLVGFSSGAHLVAVLGTDERHLAGAGLGLDHLAGVVSLDVHAYDVPLALSLMVGSEIEDNIPLIEFLFGTDLGEQQEASPVSYLDAAALPPTLVVSADPSDETTSKGYIARTCSAAYVDARLDAGHAATHLHYDDKTHSGLVLGLGYEGEPLTAALEDFLGGL